MSASIPSSTLLGVDGYPVIVEAQVSNGLPGFTLVGLPDTACREARDRVRAAFQSSDLRWPKTRITVNLAPSDLRKMGCAFDLAIAVGVLVAGGQLDAEVVRNIGFLGELGLDGTIRCVDGIVPLVDSMSCELIVVPAESINEAAVVRGKDVRGVATLRELVAALHETGDWVKPDRSGRAVSVAAEPDLSDVRGQPLARWAAEVAAAGGHNILFVGPPGSGKTMLARRLPALLPDLDDDEALAATRIHSAAGLLSRSTPLVTRPPFRAPHHTASTVAIAGGGSHAMRPGEVSLAHGGVLFLDEMAEFPRSVLDTLRQPLEEGVIRIARANATVAMPSHFLLIGATNPCPCGEGLIPGRCRCGYSSRRRYLSRLSGPLLDRFDVRVQVHRPDPERFFASTPAESSAEVKLRVAAARRLAQARGVRCNADLTTAALHKVAPLSRTVESLLMSRLRSGAITARGLDRVRRVALTLADIDAVNLGGANGASVEITDQHVCAALELRHEFRVEEDAA